MKQREHRDAVCHARVSSAELEEIRGRAAGMSLSASSYIRLMALLPTEAVGGDAAQPHPRNPATVVLVDRKTMLALLSELRRWGSQYNQAVRALNTVAANKTMRDEDAERVCDSALALLAEIAEMREALVDRVEAIMSYAAAIG